MSAEVRDAEPLMLTVENAARCLGLGRSSVYELIRSGDLPSVEVAGRRLLRYADLKQWVAGQPLGYVNGRHNGEQD